MGTEAGVLENTQYMTFIQQYQRVARYQQMEWRETKDYVFPCSSKDIKSQFPSYESLFISRTIHLNVFLILHFVLGFKYHFLDFQFDKL